MDVGLDGALRRIDALSREVHLKDEELESLLGECRRLRAELYETNRRLIEEKRRGEEARERARGLETRVEMAAREAKRAERTHRSKTRRREEEFEKMLKVKPLAFIKEKNREIREARAERAAVAAALKRVAENIGLQVEGVFEVLPACESADDPLLLRVIDESCELWRSLESARKEGVASEHQEELEQSSDEELQPSLFSGRNSHSQRAASPP